MNRLTILVGAPGSGKDTAIRPLIKGTESSVVVSSDEIRKELFGYEDQTQNSLVFAEMARRTKAYSKTHARVYYNATNLSRKRRVALCNDMKKYFTEIEVLVCLCPIEELLERNETREERHLPKDVLVRMIKSIQLPLLNEWDYANIIYMYTGAEESVKRLSLLDIKDYDQNNKHHNETLDKHIIRTANACVSNPLAFEAAVYHDMGKPFCREEGKDGMSHYRQHNLVGAYMYATNELSVCSIMGLHKNLNDVIALIEFHDHIFNFNHSVEDMREKYDKQYKDLDDEFWKAFKMLTDADRLRP